MAEKSYVSLCTKFTLFAANIIFWLLSIGVTAFGIIAQLQKSTELSNILDFFLNPAILLIVLGGYLFITTFCGCLGALRESTCLLTLYQVLISILLFVQVAVVVTFLLFFYVPQFRNIVNEYPENLLEEAISRYRDDADLKDAIDSMQKQFQCCGGSNDDQGYNDWDHNIYFNCSTSSIGPEKCGVPFSCCKPPAEGEMENLQCGYGVRSRYTTGAELETVINVQGCIRGIGRFFETNMFIIGGICLGVIILQVVVLSMSRSLKYQIIDQQNCHKSYEAR